MTVVQPMKLDLRAAHQTYKTADGQKVPGVTTVLGVLAKPSLYGWYASQEREGIFGIICGQDAFSWDKLQQSLPRYKNGNVQPFAEVKRDKAADVGTVTHARIEAWLKGTTLDPDGIPPETYEQSIHGLERFQVFWHDEDMDCLVSEHQMVSENLRVGGTCDVIAIHRPSGDRILVDIKTNAFNTSWPYAEHIAQASTYAAMAEEVNTYPIKGVWLVRVGKELNDKAQVVKLTEKQRAAGISLFTGALRCYNAKKDLD